MSDIQYLWHYTRMGKLEAIRDSGALIPISEADAVKGAANKGFHVSTTPLIWFSSNQQWEHSASQMVGLKWHTWQERATACGAIRFGINFNDERLLDWEKTCNVSFTNREDRRKREKLVKKTNKQGSNAREWFTSMEPIPLDQLRFQMWLHDEWVDADIELARFIQRYAYD